MCSSRSSCASRSRWAMTRVASWSSSPSRYPICDPDPFLNPGPAATVEPARNCMLTALLFSTATALVSSPNPVADDRASKDDYALDVSGTDDKLKIGKDGKFSLVVTPKNGKKVHPEAPLEVTFKDAKGLDR